MNQYNHTPHPQPEEDRGAAREETPAPQGQEEAPREQEAAHRQEEPKPPYKPYSRKARLWAWVGIVFMIFLVLMYTYAFSSGIILKY